MEKLIVDSLLLIIVLVAAITDVKLGKVFNVLTLPAIALGLALNAYFGGIAGLTASLEAVALAFALLIFLFALRGVGAGDVKLLMAVGALEGVAFLVTAFFWSALILGATSAAIIASRQVFVTTLPTSAALAIGRVKALPFAVPLAAGCLVTLFWR